MSAKVVGTEVCGVAVRLKQVYGEDRVLVINKNYNGDHDQEFSLEWCEGAHPFSAEEMVAIRDGLNEIIKLYIKK